MSITGTRDILTHLVTAVLHMYAVPGSHRPIGGCLVRAPPPAPYAVATVRTAFLDSGPGAGLIRASVFALTRTPLFGFTATLVTRCPFRSPRNTLRVSTHTAPRPPSTPATIAADDNSQLQQCQVRAAKQQAAPRSRALTRVAVGRVQRHGPMGPWAHPLRSVTYCPPPQGAPAGSLLTQSLARAQRASPRSSRPLGFAEIHLTRKAQRASTRTPP